MLLVDWIVYLLGFRLFKRKIECQVKLSFLFQKLGGVVLKFFQFFILIHVSGLIELMINL